MYVTAISDEAPHPLKNSIIFSVPLTTFSIIQMNFYYDKRLNIAYLHSILWEAFKPNKNPDNRIMWLIYRLIDVQYSLHYINLVTQRQINVQTNWDEHTYLWWCSFELCYYYEWYQNYHFFSARLWASWLPICLTSPWTSRKSLKLPGKFLTHPHKLFSRFWAPPLYSFILSGSNVMIDVKVVYLNE